MCLFGVSWARRLQTHKSFFYVIFDFYRCKQTECHEAIITHIIDEINRWCGCLLSVGNKLSRPWPRRAALALSSKAKATDSGPTEWKSLVRQPCSNPSTPPDRGAYQECPSGVKLSTPLGCHRTATCHGLNRLSCREILPLLRPVGSDTVSVESQWVTSAWQSWSSCVTMALFSSVHPARQRISSVGGLILKPVCLPKGPLKPHETNPKLPQTIRPSVRGWIWAIVTHHLAQFFQAHLSLIHKTRQLLLQLRI